MATIDDVLRFWFGSATSTNAAELASKVTRWYRGGETEDAAIHDSRARSSGRSPASPLGSERERLREDVVVAIEQTGVLGMERGHEDEVPLLEAELAPGSRLEHLVCEAPRPGISGESRGVPRNIERVI